MRSWCAPGTEPRRARLVAQMRSRSQIALGLLTATSAPPIGVIAADAAALIAWGALVVVSLLAVALVTVLARSRSELRARLEAIVENSPAAIFIRDRRGVFVHANPALRVLLELEPGAVIGRHVRELMPGPAGERALDADRRALAGELVAAEDTITVCGDEHVLSTVTFPISGGRGHAQVCGIVTDVTERRRLRRHLEHLVEHDALTGLYNRSHLLAEIERQLRYAERSGRPGAILLIDLDNFNVINDSRGHAMGDLVLRSAAETLVRRLRVTDTVGRSSGDEFAVLLPEVGEGHARLLAAELRTLLRNTGLGVSLNASIGIALFGAKGRLVADNLLGCADIALYEAKARGGDRTCVYRGESTGVIGWVSRIRTALETDRLVLYDLPIVELASGVVAYHELSLRMIGDRGELIAPAQFLPIAERVGLIGEIDTWVTRAGLRLALGGERVALKLSARSIGLQAIIDEALEAIAAGLDAGRVMFEITETAALGNVASAQKFIAQLRDFGFQLALDDFGTGFASFSYLRMLPIDLVKIDMDLIRDLARSEADRDVVAAIVDVAHALGKRTVAEGVADAATDAAVRALGVDYAQGFHYWRPRRISPPTQLEREQRAASEGQRGVVRRTADRAAPNARDEQPLT